MRVALFLFFLPFIIGHLSACTANDDLTEIANMKSSCRAFKTEYDKVMPAKSTRLIDAKIKECKDVGAWGENK